MRMCAMRVCDICVCVRITTFHNDAVAVAQLDVFSTFYWLPLVVR